MEISSTESTNKIDVLRGELEACEAVLKSRRVKPVMVKKGNAAFRSFQRTYENDPLAFCHDCFNFPDNWIWTPYQKEIIGEMLVRQRQALYGPRGLGKTGVAAGLVWWAVLTSPDVKAPTTASAWRQLDKFLWPEIHKLYRWLNWDIIGREPLNHSRELKTLSIEIDGSKNQTAFAVASNDSDKIEGAHASHRVFIVIDEGKAVKDQTFDSMEGAFSQCDQPLALALSTPGPMLGRFYDICSHRPGYEDWHVRHVTVEEAISSGRMRREWKEQREQQWGTDSAVYRNHVLGEFAQDADRTVIPLGYVEQANQRWEEWRDSKQLAPIDTIGVDPARGGGDKTVIAFKSGSIITELITLDTDDTMNIVSYIEPIMAANPLSQAVIDVIGIGAGIFDRLRQLNRNVIAFNASERPTTTDRSGQLAFKNKRSQAWWLTREALDPTYNSAIALPLETQLTGELTTPRYDDRNGLITVESKFDIRSKLGRSTDMADAVIMALVGSETCPQYKTEVISYADFVAQLEQEQHMEVNYAG